LPITLQLPHAPLGQSELQQIPSAHTPLEHSVASAHGSPFLCFGEQTPDEQKVSGAAAQSDSAAQGAHFVPLQKRLAQSVVWAHPFVSVQAGHSPPPQSTSVSLPFFVMSVHAGATQAPLPSQTPPWQGVCTLVSVLTHAPPLQVNSSQSVDTPHSCGTMHSGPPPAPLVGSLGLLMTEHAPGRTSKPPANAATESQRRVSNPPIILSSNGGHRQACAPSPSSLRARAETSQRRTLAGFPRLSREGAVREVAVLFARTTAARSSSAVFAFITISSALVAWS
jgi:hypothetical protein